MNEDKKIAETPLMKQYFSVKSKYPEAILLFRVGDFYETYGEDAIVASKILGIILTKRANGSSKHVEMAGFPYHAIDTYLPKLVREGYKVAICDQLEDPKLAKKIVKRGITELVTPGVVFNEQLLTNKENNYLAAAYFESDKAGVAFLDISTGSFKVASGDLQYIELLLNSFAPKEILLQKSYKKGFEEHFGKDIYISTMDEWAFVTDSAREKLQTHFGVSTLKGFGIDQYPLAITAAGAILYYLELTQHEGISHICSISRIDEGDFVWIDRFTFRNLEVFKSASENGSSLTEVIDRTSSPMGARLLRNWLAMPIKNVPEIEHRQNIVEKFLSDQEMRDKIRQLLKEIGDQERIISRAAAGKITPREVVQLRRGLENTKPIKDILNSSGLKELADISLEVDPCDELLNRLARELIEDPASQLGKGDVIANGISQELDSLRKIVHHGKEILENIQAREIEKTGISSLKISYNNVFGYYLEVRNTHKDKVPSDWIRKQTLVSAERYITQELKEYEEKIIGAEEKILNLESSLFFDIVLEIKNNIAVMQKNAALLSKIDLLASFAELAHSNNYKRPIVNLEDKIIIQKGRHPVIETIMAPGEEYIPNDLYLDNSTQQIMILTGPNMSGKSALLRQTALIVLLTQIGSFVPAESATIGMIDKIFTRVGATDNISRGESTFMVEMLETATILHNLSNRSLVLLDEIGRGTSTYDGMSIARAIIEYIHEHKEFRAKTIFATHYHELNDLENMFERVKNYHISVKEVENRVVFLRKLLPGGVAHSFGIHVARMAGMPLEVVKRAERILKQLENKKEKKDNSIQLSLFQLEEDPLLTSIRDELKEIDINKISPLEAFDILRTLKQKTGL